MKPEKRTRNALRGSTTSVLTLGGAAGLAFGGRAAYLRFRRRIAANALVLNETLPINSKWWRDLAKKNGDLLYVAMGDSAAQGIGASAPARGYVGLLAQQIRETTGRTVRVLNLSVSGATVGLAVRDQLPRFMKVREPDVVTVAIGANDIALWDPVAFEAGIRQLFGALPAHAIVADLPCFHLPHNERKVAIANGIVRRAAAENSLTLAPLHEATRRQGIRRALGQVANDMFHPNDRGYRIWADAFAPVLDTDLRRRFPQATDAVETPQVGAAADGSVGGGR